MSTKNIFCVQFVNQGQVYEIYAKQVRQPELYGFVEIAGLVFGERSTVLIDPSQERLKSEFSGVESTLVPLHSVVRIDKVEREGIAKIIPLDGNSAATTGATGLPHYGRPKKE